jgi:hypothetical protein
MEVDMDTYDYTEERKTQAEGADASDIFPDIL